MDSRTKVFFSCSLLSILVLFASFSFLFMDGVVYTSLDGGLACAATLKVYETIPQLLLILIPHAAVGAISILLLFKKHFWMVIVQIILVLWVFVAYFVMPMALFTAKCGATTSLGFGFPLMAISVFVSLILFLVAYFLKPTQSLRQTV